MKANIPVYLIVQPEIAYLAKGNKHKWHTEPGTKQLFIPIKTEWDGDCKNPVGFYEFISERCVSLKEFRNRFKNSK